MRAGRWGALLVILLLLPSAAALRVAPERPVAGRPAAIHPEGPASADLEVLYLGEANLAATVATGDGVHFHAPKVGGNLLHVPGGPAPTVAAARDDALAAWVGAAAPYGAGWVIPVAFPDAGNWTLQIGGSTLRLGLLATPKLARVDGDLLVALETPFAPASPSADVVVHLARRAGDGWVPVTGPVRLTFAGATVAANPLGPGRYAATLPVPGAASLELAVNASGEAARLPLRSTAKAADGPEPPGAGGRAVTFHLAGRYLVAAHEPDAAFHAAKVVTVAAAGVAAVPLFPSTVPRQLNATFRLVDSNGAAVSDPGEVRIGLDGAALAPARAYGQGVVGALVTFPADGPYKLRLVAPDLEVNRTFSVEARADPVPDATEPRPWWRALPAPAAALAVAAAAAAAWGWRRRT